jgi:hypothetical protein
VHREIKKGRVSSRPFIPAENKKAVEIKRFSTAFALNYIKSAVVKPLH